MPTNIEIKAKCRQSEKIREILASHNARFVGIDRQIDTYFKVQHGRMKLREGNIENHLIHYHRDNQAGPKKSEVILYRPSSETLKPLLTTALNILVVVDKQRAIYFIDNVKFHIDEVKELGAFVEIEAIDKDGSISEKELEMQCKSYLALFGIEDRDLMETSYSDMLLNNKK